MIGQDRHRGHPGGRVALGLEIPEGHAHGRTARGDRVACLHPRRIGQAHTVQERPVRAAEVGHRHAGFVDIEHQVGAGDLRVAEKQTVTVASHHQTLAEHQPERARSGLSDLDHDGTHGRERRRG